MSQETMDVETISVAVLA